MSLIDLTTDFGKRVACRLQEDWIIWLTSVGEDGTPQPRPVWFLWDGETFLIYSRPDTHKLSHIARHPRVALNLDGDGKGGDIIVFTGDAVMDPDALPANQVPAYAEKYAAGLERINMTPEAFAQAYSATIRVRPVALRGH